MVTKAFLKITKKQLEQEKQEISKKSLYKHDVDTDGDETDEIQANVIIEMQSQLHGRNQFKLRQIADALKKISDNEYGLCQDCNEPIPEKRLAINPYVLTCISCAEDREIEDKKKRY